MHFVTYAELLYMNMCCVVTQMHMCLSSKPYIHVKHDKGVIVTCKDLRAVCGLTRTTITTRIRFLSLPCLIQQLIKDMGDIRECGKEDLVLTEDNAATSEHCFHAFDALYCALKHSAPIEPKFPDED